MENNRLIAIAKYVLFYIIGFCCTIQDDREEDLFLRAANIQKTG